MVIFLQNIISGASKSIKDENALAQKEKFTHKVICPLLNALEDIWIIPFFYYPTLYCILKG